MALAKGSKATPAKGASAKGAPAKGASAKAAPMNRGDVSGAIAAKFGMPMTQADAITKEYEAIIVRALTSGQEVRLAGFGSFKVSDRAARMGRNPQTGEMKQIAARKVPRFQPGKAVKDAIMGTQSGGGGKGGAKSATAKAGAAKSGGAAKSEGAGGGAKSATASTSGKGGAAKGGAAGKTAAAAKGGAKGGKK